jgi:dihydrolipoamide dehydrogenase
MKRVRVDVAIIGAGTAGLSARRAATANGASTVLVEGGPYGTTCARVGCMPSKLLIAAAEAAHAVAAAPGFGVHVDGSVRVDGRAVMTRVKSERDRFVGFVLRDVERMPAADKLVGHARFVDDRTLDVGGHTLVTAACIVIATGSRPTRPPHLAALGERAIVNDDVFEWDDLPRAVAVAGAGIIGLELGQALHRLGVRVTIYGRGGRVGPLRDPEVLAVAQAIFRAELALENNAPNVDFARDGDEVAITRHLPDGTSRTERYDYLLAATGRVPNVAALGLEATSLERDDDGVPVFDPATGRTRSASSADANESTIFIAGDVGGYRPLLHEAADEGHIAGANAARLALGKPVTPGPRRAAMEVVFTDPQLAIVGGGYPAQAPGSFVTGRVSFENQGRSRVLMRNKGLLHVYADSSTRQFGGAEMVAPAAEHLAHLLAWSLQNRLTIDRMLAMPFYHPVIEEGLRTALYDARAKLDQAQAAAAAPHLRTPTG